MRRLTMVLLVLEQIISSLAPAVASTGTSIASYSLPSVLAEQALAPTAMSSLRARWSVARVRGIHLLLFLSGLSTAAFPTAPQASLPKSGTVIRRSRETIERQDQEFIDHVLNASPARQERFFKDFPDRVWINAHERFDPENGRTIYFRLQRPVTVARPNGQTGVIEYVRAKGVRSRQAPSGGDVHTGNGRPDFKLGVTPSGEVSARDPADVPHGGMVYADARLEFRAMERADDGGLEVDCPMVLGELKTLRFRGHRLGYVLAGMESEDARLLISVKHAAMVMRASSGKVTYFDPSTTASLLQELGRTLRRMHDLGIFHQFAHLGNFGFQQVGDSWRIIVRDLDTAVFENELKGTDEQRVRQAATYRLNDFHRLLADLIVLEQLAPAVKTIDHFLIGYFSELEVSGARWEEIRRTLLSKGFYRLPGLYHTFKGPFKMGRSDSIDSTLWNELYRLSDKRESSGPTPVRSRDVRK